MMTACSRKVAVSLPWRVSDRTKAEVQKLLLVLDADASDMDEDDCKAAWRDADAQLLKSIIVRRLQ